MTSTTVTNDFTYILARSPIGTEGQAYDSLLTNGVYNTTTLAQALAGSTEAQNYVDPVVLLYETSFGHIPDNAGLQFWVNQFELASLGGASKLTANALAAPVTAANGATTAQVAAYNNALVEVSNSFVQVLINTNFGGVTPTNTQFVEYLYQNLLGHAADASGLAYWVNALSTQSMGSVLANFVAVANTQSTNTTAIQSWLIAAGTTGTPPATINFGGGTVTLTTGTDTVNGATTVTADLSPYTLNGQGPTLNAGDSISNVTTLNIADQYGQANDVIPMGVTLSNIQTINLQTAGNAGTGVNGGGSGSGTGAIFDVSGVSGLTAVNVTSSGSGTDTVQASATTAITVNHNNVVGGAVDTIGGSTVNVTTSAGNVIVGHAGTGISAPLASQVAAGAVTVEQNGTGTVRVFGGTDVNVSVTASGTTGQVDIGNTAANTGDRVAGAVANPTGNVTVNQAGTGAINVMGGSSVTISDTAIGGTGNAAGNITVGDVNAVVASNQSSGPVTITETAQNTFDGLAGATHNNVAGGSISVYGGTDVNVTTNAGGSVFIGSDASKGTDPSGNVSVTSTGVSLSSIQGNIGVAGGADVTVSTAGGAVTVGQVAGTGHHAVDNPTGAVSVTNTVDTAKWTGNEIVVDGGTTVNVVADGSSAFVGQNAGATGSIQVTQAATLTGSGYAGGLGSVVVDGGANVSVTTTGGSVTVGEAGSVSQAFATGAVSIKDTFSGAKGANGDSFQVLGGTTVNIATNATNGSITVGGGAPSVDDTGVALKNATQYATDNVTIVNDTVNGSTTTYGQGATNVYTNGAATVSITGGAVGAVTDANTVLATAGAGAGQPIGTSHLTSVVLAGDQAGLTTVTSNALSSLTLTSSSSSVTVVDATKGHALSLVVGGDKADTVTDTTAGTVTVTDNGKSFAGTAGTSQHIVATAATAATFSNSAAQAFSLVGDTALTSITASNSGSLNLGDLTGLTKLATITAATATGAISATIDGTVTSFNGAGSTGNETITLVSNSLLHSDGTTYSNIIGGSGSNTIVANYAASASDVALGNNAHISGFTTLALGANATDGTAGQVYNPGAAAVSATAQVDTVTISGAAPVVGDVYAIDVVVGAAAPVTATFTATGGETPAQIAAALAGALLSQGITGVTVGYTSGSASFTVTGPTTSAISVTVDGSTTTAADITPAVTTTFGAGSSSVTADNSYNAAGFTALTVGQTAGDVAFTNVAAGATLAITASQGGANVVDYLLANSSGSNDTMSMTVGIDGTTKTGTGAITSTVLTTGIENLSIASQGMVKDATGAVVTNTLAIGDTAAKTVTITGDQAVKVTLNTDTNTALTEAASSVTKIDASGSSGAVDVSSVALKSGASHSILGGSGLLTAAGGTNAADVDAITTGAGGGKITIGAGGSWTGTAYGSGSETINLSAATVASTLILNDGAVATYNGSKGGVTGFVNTDVLHFANAGVADAKTVLATNTTTQGVMSGALAGAAAGGLDTTGALGTALANLNYTVSNGVITFSASGGHQLSDFTTGQLISAAEIIVNGSGLDNQIAAFTVGGNTYVVTDDGAHTLGAGTGNLDTITELMGVSSVAGFGTTVAAGTILSDDVVNQNGGVTATGTSALTYNETGYAADSIATFGSSSTTISNLAASAALTLNDGGAASTAAVTISQIGSAATDSLTLNLAGADTYKSLTVSDALLVLNPMANNTIQSLVDASGNLTTLTVANGGGTLDIQAISASNLTTIDAHNDGAAITLGDVTAIANNNLSFLLSTTANSTITASGSADVFTQGTSIGAGGAGSVTIMAAGVGDTFTLSSTAAGNSIIAAGAGDTIKLGNSAATGGYTVVAQGANDVITFTSTHDTASTVTVGSNATVTLGAGNEAIVIAGDQTGGTSASFALTTLKNAADNVGETVSFVGDGNAHALLGASVAASQVNVSAATTLAQALDIAANITALTQQPGTAAAAGNGLVAGHAGVIDWFQFGGNTYIVDAVNSTSSAAGHTALGSHDYVVELTGLVNIGAAGALAANTLTL